ncbi:type IX secretion system membrane protein PorP/SprF [Cesiribacter andamanensis]|uniref:Bacteroidetes-specific putative membrane protein n=1 Tax=Cesiribacter andamanensis AMV16 TaxID=1279009 RepID=M7NKK3_9BACT|nr:type IX secretion system membrane protein PorP/SprF [Cesiribacter andamanensis]EMR02290.1 Bacteroidetes-specific putative membrane protein [Cesiribacter andamanensis AMV16]
MMNHFIQSCSCYRLLAGAYLLLLSAGGLQAQIRAFDNSRALMPWMYNPAAELPTEHSAYMGYDARGNSSVTPHSILAGLRMPVLGETRGRGQRGPSGVVGLQALNTSQSFANALTVSLSYAHQLALTDKLKMGVGVGMGIFNFSFDQSQLVYMDQQDPFFNNGNRLFNLHVQTGIALVADDRLFLQLAAPDLLRNNRANMGELVVRTGFVLPLNPQLKLIPALNLDTYNASLIYGGDLRLEWRNMFSLLAGADRYKLHGGMQLRYKSMGFGYVYGQNLSGLYNHIESHQITLQLAAGKNGRRGG